MYQSTYLVKDFIYIYIYMYMLKKKTFLCKCNQSINVYKLFSLRVHSTSTSPQPCENDYYYLLYYYKKKWDN